ncbi:MAG: hypothetical protein V4813_08755 [Gemmatimonadota bacterium]
MKGRCVICSALGKLTADHVPPKALVPATAVEVQQLIAATGGRHDDLPRPRGAFQAPRFPSLCAECNNQRLGARADVALIAMAAQLARWVNAARMHGILLPDRAELDVDAQGVARAVIGHLLAAEERSTPSAPLANGTALFAMRAFFLERATEPPPFRLFVWPFLGTDITIVRGFSLARVLGDAHGPVIGDVLKFFPLAFWLVHHAPDDVVFPFAQIPLQSEGICRLRIPLRRLPPQWPEMPGPKEVVALTAERTYLARQSAPAR